MAYCLRSFVQTLEQVLNPQQHHRNWVLDLDKIPQTQSLYELGSFLRDFLDGSPPLIQERIATLEDRIMEAAEKAENTLESHIASQILSSPEGQSFMISPPVLDEVIQVFEVAKQEAIKIMTADQHSENNMPPSIGLSTRYPSSKNIVVGVKEDLIQLKSRLTARASNLDIIPVVGMGGMGKTTLARILYDEYSLSNKSYFDCHAWVTVSQSYTPQLIIKTLLACVTGEPLNEMSHRETSELIVTLYQTLFNRRYLIVIDDVWSCKAWDDVQMAFPRDNQGSRIILTTRDNSVADYVKPNSHVMHLINEDDSWELLRGEVFGEESCPRELEEVGKKIALNCGGLPLALKVIAGLLSHSQRSKYFWEYVAYDVSSLIAKTNDRFAGIFSWSFAHLPHYLKPCFLYMGVFPEDSNIQLEEIMKLWIAEGFLYPICDKSLEEAAAIHLNALVDKNLIFVRKRSYNGEAIVFGIHDLLRDLCLKRAREKKCLCFVDSKSNNLQEEDILNYSHVSVYLSDNDSSSFKLTPHARSFQSRFYASQNQEILSCLCFKLSLLRVLSLGAPFFYEFPEIILELIMLRYLAITTRVIPRTISKLRNLQSLIVGNITTLAVISDLPQLRNLDYSNSIEKCKGFLDVHENLRTLSLIEVGELKELLGKLPNLCHLGITFEYLGDGIELTSFHNLEKLHCIKGFYRDGTFISNVTFPYSLKSLDLFKCGVSQSLLDAIGILPNLEALYINCCAFDSSWEPSENEFCQLQLLQISNCSIKSWLATDFHFPVLRQLIIHDCECLDVIPNDIGHIETLEIIDVNSCKASVLDSARRIFEEQYQLGNTLLQLRLGSSLEEENQEE